MRNALSIVAGVIFVAGFVPYIRAILKRETRPAKSTWIIWATLDSIVLAGMYAKGSVNGMIVGATSGACVVALLSLKYGIPGWSKLDKLCLYGAAIAISLWQVFNSPLLGLLISLVVIFTGSIPTIVSAWNDPSRENRLGWTLFWISCICTIIATPEWSLAHAAQPLSFFTVESTMMCLLYIKPACFS